MANYTTITDIVFEFSPLHLTQLEYLDHSLNNFYSKFLEDPVTMSLYTDSNKTTFQNDAITLIRSGIFDIITANSRSNRFVVEPLIDALPLYSVIGSTSNKSRCPLRSVSTLATAFAAQVKAAKTHFTINLMTGIIFVANDYDPNDFTGFFLTCVVPTLGNLGAQQTSNVTNPANPANPAATAATTAAAQALAAASIAVTLPVAFNSRNLPTNVCAWYNSLNNLTKITTKTAMVAFNQPTGD